MASRYGDVIRNKEDLQAKESEVPWWDMPVSRSPLTGYENPIEFRQREIQEQFERQERPGWQTGGDSGYRAPHFYDQMQRANTWEQGDYYITGPELSSWEQGPLPGRDRSRPRSSGFAPDQRLYRQAMGDDGYRRPVNYAGYGYNDTQGLRDQRDRVMAQTGRPTPPQRQGRWRPHRQPVQGVIDNVLQQIVADYFYNPPIRNPLMMSLMRNPAEFK